MRILPQSQQTEGRTGDDQFRQIGQGRGERTHPGGREARRKRDDQKGALADGGRGAYAAGGKKPIAGKRDRHSGTVDRPGRFGYGAVERTAQIRTFGRPYNGYDGARPLRKMGGASQGGGQYAAKFGFRVV